MFSRVIYSILDISTAKYLLVGGLTVLIDYLTIYILYSIVEANYIIAIIFGFLFSNIFQFFSNFFYTFQLKKETQIKKRAIAYIISAVIGMTIGTLTIIALESVINSLYISKGLSLIVSFAYGFFASKYIVYNKNLKL